MKVLLLQDVKDVGKTGELKDVSAGFARNFLLPRRLATVATAGELASVAERKRVEAKQEAKAQAISQEIGNRIAETTLVFRAKVGEQHRLYGSITSADIAEALNAKLRSDVDKRKIELEEPIRQIGTHKVAVRLAKNVTPEITVVVEPE